MAQLSFYVKRLSDIKYYNIHNNKLTKRDKEYNTNYHILPKVTHLHLLD